MASHRLLRVNELLKREIGEALRRELPVGEAGLVSVNDVEVAGDLKSAKVFVSFYGSSEQQRTAQTKLQALRQRVQDLVARAVILKYTPKLQFVSDDSISRGNRVLQIIDELDKTDDGAQ